MSSAYGLLRGTRALLAAAKSAAASAPKAGVTAAPSKKVAAAAAAAPPKSPKKKRAVKAPSGPTGIQAMKPISPTLQEFMGEPEISRIEAVKKVWEYIKRNELQNPANKREIFCDEKLKTIFQGKDKVTFLEIGGLLSLHFVKTA